MKSITVLGQTYKIKKVKGLAEEQGLHGLCCGETRTILLDADLKKAYMKRVLYHEIGHAFSFECGLGDFMDRNSLEMFAQMFSNFLITFV